MVRRGWSVGLLREFIPRSANLLGLNKNGGEEICIRLVATCPPICPLRSRVLQSSLRSHAIPPLSPPLKLSFDLIVGIRFRLC